MMIATMRKSTRSKIEEVYVLGFVPSYLLPNKRACSLDPFLDPLVCELEDSLINGNHTSLLARPCVPVANLLQCYSWALYT